MNANKKIFVEIAVPLGHCSTFVEPSSPAARFVQMNRAFGSISFRNYLSLRFQRGQKKVLSGHEKTDPNRFRTAG
ncbi:MAG: hypothetical protein PHP93_04190, partial [Kiritimatiellales bacterium]|nr:hypothetical protein [Kiritimatiellales bacterium]